MITKKEFEEALKTIENYRKQLLQEIEQKKGEIKQIEKNKSLIVSKNDSILDIEDISVRALNVLRYNEIEYIGDLMLMDTEDLMKYHNCGRKTVTEINECRERLILRD